jgi:nickel-type superoxide dismutase maturation protease
VVHRELKTSLDTSLPKASFLQIFNWLLGRFKRYRVAGLSMDPTFVDGQTVLVNSKAYEETKPLVGQIVLARLPSTSNPCIKRVEAIVGDRFDLRGDNPSQSTDSRTAGLIPGEDILGQVICTFP